METSEKVEEKKISHYKSVNYETLALIVHLNILCGFALERKVLLIPIVRFVS